MSISELRYARSGRINQYRGNFYLTKACLECCKGNLDSESELANSRSTGPPPCLTKLASIYSDLSGKGGIDGLAGRRWSMAGELSTVEIGTIMSSYDRLQTSITDTLICRACFNS